MNTLKSKTNLVQKIPVLAVLAALIVCVPLRIYQYCKLINPTTGFYDKSGLSIVIVYALLTAAVLVCIGFSYFKHKSIQPVTIGKNSKIFFAVSIVMAIGVVVDSLSILFDYINLYTTKVSGYINISEYVESQGGTLMLLQAVFGFVSVVFFLISGLSALNKAQSFKFRILALAPVIWCVFKLLFRFKRTISFVNVSDLLLELFAIVFSMMFFLAFAQIKSKIEAESIFWKLFGYGLPAAMFTLICFLPRFILLITGNSDKLNTLYPANLSDLTFAVYSVYICISSVKAELPETSEQK
jgi:hypothetical protein